MRATGSDDRLELTVDLSGDAGRLRVRIPIRPKDVLTYHPGAWAEPEYRYLIGIFVDPPESLTFRTDPIAAAVVDRYLFAVVARDSDPMIIDVDGREIGAMSGPPEIWRESQH